ncbi:unnamed protein product [Chilo suppressalis]|uniref:Peptidase S1 domain-containing protein n=1 Tax=Chilo suppressalis TaxID=168631 RepID=A0ABN8B085_CHISP|nr:unnamed protein product [Chilo suppressalis]
MIGLLVLLFCSKSDAATSVARIIGGQDASLHLYQNIVRIEELERRGQTFHRCSGTVLTSTWVLSAAHCFDKDEDQIRKYVIRYRYGEVSGAPGNNDTFAQVIKIKQHPSYLYREQPQSVFRNDICLVKTTPIHINQYRLLSAVEYTSLFGQEVMVAGYGIMKMGNDIEDTLTLKKPLQVLKLLATKCPKDGDFSMDPGICAVTRCGEMSYPCEGDSGGPLLHSSRVAAVLSSAEASYCTEKIENHYFLYAAYTPPGSFKRAVKVRMAGVAVARIIGGQDASLDLYQNIARIEELKRRGQTSHRCSGTVLTSTWVLSAAHCFDKDEDQIRKFVIRYRYGEVSGAPGNNDTFAQVIKIKQHPSYLIRQQLESVSRNDICLVKTTPIHINQYRLLSAVEYTSLFGQEVMVAGYGIMKMGNDIEDTLTLKKPLQVLKLLATKCPKDGDLICAVTRCGEMSYPCEGDSGGPLLHASRVAAVLSSAEASYCTEKIENHYFLYAAYTPVSPYINWIYNEIKNETRIKRQPVACGRVSPAARDGRRASTGGPHASLSRAARRRPLNVKRAIDKSPRSRPCLLCRFYCQWDVECCQ